MSNYTPSLRSLVIWPDQKLRTTCNPVDNTDNVQQLITDMRYTVQHHNGYGLAAPQVGELLNVIVVHMPHEPNPLTNESKEQTTDESSETKGAFIETMINPKLVTTDDTYTFPWNEGCLSVPGYFEQRRRPQRIVVEYQNEKGFTHRQEAQGLAAFIIQHELDHLDGKVFVDDLSRLKQQRVRKKIDKTLRQYGRKV